MIKSAPHNSSFACGVFIDLQRAFDTISHDILLSKLNHYNIRVVAFDWFKSYLSESSIIKDLKSKLHHFVDDADLLNASSSLKGINKNISFYL